MRIERGKREEGRRKKGGRAVHVRNICTISAGLNQSMIESSENFNIGAEAQTIRDNNNVRPSKPNDAMRLEEEGNLDTLNEKIESELRCTINEALRCDET